MKKYFLLLALLLSTFALVACGQNGNGGAEGSPIDVHVEVTPSPPAQVENIAPPPPEVATGTRAYILANIPDIPPSDYIIWAATIGPDSNIMHGWTNPTILAATRVLIFEGMGTMARNHMNEWFPNPIVMVDGAFPVSTYNADGSRTLHFTIYPYNQFSDGTFITAADYVGRYVMMTSSFWLTVAPTVSEATEVVGRNAWRDGADTFTGFRLYSPTEFSVTICPTHMPHVWEVAQFMSWHPFPMHAVGMEVHDDGNGAFLTGPNRTPMTNEAFALAINGGTPEYQRDEAGEIIIGANGQPTLIGGDGFRFRPTVFPGPYTLTSVDVGGGTVILTANPYFSGSWDGHRPRIETIIMRFTPSPLLVDALASGEVHIATNQDSGEFLLDAFAHLVDIPNPTHTFVNYYEMGQRIIQFHSDYGPTQFREVRQAIGFLIDRYAFSEMFSRGFGVVPHGPYAAAWWWYQYAMDAGMRDRLIIYDLNIAHAISLLEASGWNYAADGSPFVGPGDGANNIRHKWVDGELMPLEIRWNTATAPRPQRDYLELQLFDNLAAAGMRLIQNRYANWPSFMMRTPLDLDRYNMWDVGQGMARQWAPWWLFAPEQIPSSNWGQVDNPEVLALAQRLRANEVITDAGRAAFIEDFIDFMVLLNYELYSIPLSMALAHDFVPVWLGGWFNTGVWSFEYAILRAYIR
jgi:peptide/nickel transport system substrate-binding protein